MLASWWIYGGFLVEIYSGLRAEIWYGGLVVKMHGGLLQNMVYKKDILTKRQKAKIRHFHQHSLVWVCVCVCVQDIPTFFNKCDIFKNSIAGPTMIAATVGKFIPYLHMSYIGPCNAPP